MTRVLQGYMLSPKFSQYTESWRKQSSNLTASCTTSMLMALNSVLSSLEHTLIFTRLRDISALLKDHHLQLNLLKSVYLCPCSIHHCQAQEIIVTATKLQLTITNSITTVAQCDIFGHKTIRLHQSKLHLVDMFLFKATYNWHRTQLNSQDLCSRT